MTNVSTLYLFRYCSQHKVIGYKNYDFRTPAYMYFLVLQFKCSVPTDYGSSLRFTECYNHAFVQMYIYQLFSTVIDFYHVVSMLF